jgi:hypothetical protein
MWSAEPVKNIKHNAAPGKPRAIETVYRGYRFRSRLEARWAVFFDRIGHEWEYEPEGFELPSGRYLPDFRIKDFDVYVEIKPKEPEAREMALQRDMYDAGADLLILWGSDPADIFSQWKWPDHNGHPRDPRKWIWPTEGKIYGMKFPPVIRGKLAFFIATFCFNQRRTYAACVAARQARFEHGEQP